MDLKAGQIIHRYQIIDLLGEGGMGLVYKAYDLTLQRDVAIKMLHAQFARQKNFQERFLQEARTAARLTHPGIVQVHDFGQYQGQAYIVMEFIPGPNLGQILRDLRRDMRAANRWIPLGEAVGLLSQVALSLHFAHQNGVLHRDIKPDNIMLRPEPAGGLPYRPILTDLGLAKLAEGGLQTQEGTSMGTPAYMSPEQALGQDTDARSDVYSLGILLFELATGRLPFPARSLPEAVRYHTQVAPPAPRAVRPDLPEALEAVILRAIEKEPARRFPSAGDLSAALVHALPAATQAAEQQRTALGETAGSLSNPVSLITQYQKSLLEPRGPSVLKEFAPPTHPGEAQVQVMRDGKTIHSAPLGSREISIGRDAANTLCLDDGMVSRMHARIERGGEGYTITDLNSTNGTFLDNARLLPGIAEPWPEDRAVRVGSFYLRIIRGPALDRSRVQQDSSRVLDGRSVQPADGSAGGTAPVSSTASASLALENTRYSVAPGSSVTIPLSVINQGELVEHYRLSVTGIPAEWIAGGLEHQQQPLLTLALLPGDRGALALTIQPPRAPTAYAGSYAVSLSLVSEASSRAAAAASLTLEVQPYSQVSCAIHPETPRANQNARLVLRNQGNSPQTFQITWSDPANELVFDPPETTLDVEGGKAAEVGFRGRLRQERWVGGEKLHRFQTTVHVANAQPQSLPGQIISRGLVPTWLIPLVMSLCVLLAAAAGAYYGLVAQPKAAAEQAAATALADNLMIAAKSTEQNSDPDGDGLPNALEGQAGTNPALADTDGDGLNDGEEVNIHSTEPKNRDTDGDTWADGFEVQERGTNPRQRDTDGDGLLDNLDPDPGSLPTATPSPTETPVPSATAMPTQPPAPTQPPPPTTAAAPTQVPTEPPTETPVLVCDPARMVPLKTYYNADRKDNFTTAAQASEEDALQKGYRSIRTEGYVYREQIPGTVPLITYWNGERLDNLGTSTAAGAAEANRTGYLEIRVEGYLYPDQLPGTIPLKTYWNASRLDNVLTGSEAGEAEAVRAGYRPIRVEGYICP